MINQEDLLQSYERPSFNSNCLESLFHLIPNLSTQFIVMNDDYFFGRAVHPSDFFTLTPAVTSSSSTSSSYSSRRGRGSVGENGDGEEGGRAQREVGIKMFLEPESYGYAENWRGEDQWPRSVRLTAKAVQEAYGEIFNEKTRITGESRFSRRFYSHVASSFRIMHGRVLS